MAITANTQALASDFVATSAGAGDSGKVPKLNGSGVLDTSFTTWKGLLASGEATHDISSNSAQTIAHGLGVTPKMVKITVTLSGTGAMSIAVLTYKSAQSAVKVAGALGSATNNSSGNDGHIYTDIGSPLGTTVGLSAPDATNINITWSKDTSSTGTAYIMWEAYA